MEGKLMMPGGAEENDLSPPPPESLGRRKSDLARSSGQEASDVPGKEGEIPLDPDDEDEVEEEIPDSDTGDLKPDQPVGSR